MSEKEETGDKKESGFKAQARIMALCKRNLDKLPLDEAELVVRHLHEHVMMERRKEAPRPTPHPQQLVNTIGQGQYPQGHLLPGFE